MSTLLVLDWDDVIADDDAFKRSLLDLLVEKGLTLARATELYNQTKDKDGYNDRRLARAVAKELQDNPEDIFELINEATVKRASQFLYPDAVEFIESAIVQGYELMVLTAGNEEIQSKKVLHSELHDRFDKVHIVSGDTTKENKEHILADLAKTHDQVIFYDDKLTTIIHLHEVFRGLTSIVPVWVNRGMTEHPYMNGFVTTKLSLAELQDAALAKKRTLIAGAYITDGQQVLMVQEKGRATGLWSLPIGHVEADEICAVSIEREVAEETGYSIELTGPRTLIAVDGDAYMGGEQDIPNSIIIVCFNTEIIGGALYPDKSFVLDAAWFSRDKAKALPLRGAWERQLMAERH